MFKKYLLEITVFVCGTVLMILEMVGSRVLAPFFGTSIVVWTSLIGIILGALSLGYLIGGKLADRVANLKVLSFIIFGAAILIVLSDYLKNGLMGFLSSSFGMIYLNSVIATVFLFGPASILLGMVSPYAVKLKMNNLDNSGQTVGRLYAISSIGSILGTFLGGFWLISFFGTTELLLLLSVVLILMSIFCYSGFFLKGKFWLIFFILSFLAFHNYYQKVEAKNGIVDVDTKYNRVWVYPGKINDRLVRVLTTEIKGSQSAMFLNTSTTELVFDYTKYYNLFYYFQGEVSSSLMIGGGAYSYPKYYLDRFASSTIDVVEIDSGMTELAKKFFDLKEDKRLNIFHQDGRTFLNNNQKKYQTIFVDAFRSFFAVPFQLTTVEAVQKIYNSLSDQGLVLVNIASAFEGDKGKFLRAEYATYKQVFPKVLLFSVKDKSDGEILQNILLLGFKDAKMADFTHRERADQEINSYLDDLWTKEVKLDLPILTDDFAPVDNYIAELL